MPFDLETSKPVGGFNLETSSPVEPENSTVFMEQDETVIDFPSQMSEKEMRYSYDTQVRQKNKGEFFGMLPVLAARMVQPATMVSQPNLDPVTEFGKGLGAFVSSALAETPGQIIRAMASSDVASEGVEFSAVKSVGMALFSKMKGQSPKETETQIREFGEGVVSKTRKLNSVLGLEPSDEEGLSGDVDRFMFNLGSGGGSVLASFGLLYLTKSPAAVAPFFGAMQYGQIFDERVAAGEDPNKAKQVALKAGAFEAGLESIGFSILLKSIKASKPLVRRVLPMVVEGFQEAEQQVAEEFFQQDVRQDKFSVVAGRVIEAAVIGSVVGGGVSVINEAISSQGMADELAEIKNVSPEVAAEEMANLAQQLVDEGVIEQSIEELISDEISPISATKEERQQGIATIKEELNKLSEKPQKQTDKNKVQFERILGEKLTKKVAEVTGREAELDILREEEPLLTSYIDSLQSVLANEELTNKQKVEEANKTDAGLVFDSVEDVNTFVDDLVSNRQEIRRRISDIRFGFKKQLESTIIKNKVQDMLRGARKGKVIAKEEIAEIQGEVRGFVEQTSLARDIKDRLLRGVERVNSESKLNKRLEKLEQMVVDIEEQIQRRGLVSKFKELTKRENIRQVSAEFRGPLEAAAAQFDPSRITGAKIDDLTSLASFLINNPDNKIPASRLNQLNRLNKRGLDTLSLEELQEVVDTLEHAVHLSETKQRILLGKREQKLDDIIEGLKESIKKEIGVDIFEDDLSVMPTTRRMGLEQTKRNVKKFLNSTRKFEFLLRQIGAGQVFDIIRASYAQELKLQSEFRKRLAAAFGQLEGSPADIASKRFSIEGVRNVQDPDGWTREELISVVLNSKNPGNLQRLEIGNNLTQDEIILIEENVNSRAGDAQFVEDVFNILDSVWPHIAQTVKRLTGFTPPKVAGRYFPIVVDRAIARQQGANKSDDLDVSLDQRIYEAIQFKDSFTKERVGGVDPVLLTGFNTILTHVEDGIHYATMAEGVNDVKKVLKDPRVSEAMQSLLGDDFAQTADNWMRDVANPKRLRAKNIAEQTVNHLRHLSSVYFLGHSVTVSAVQASSFALIPKEIGLKHTAIGLNEFLTNRKETIEFVRNKSAIIAARDESMIRMMDDFLNTDQVQKFIKGKALDRDIYFSWIRAVDMSVVLPAWMGSYSHAVDSKENGGLGMGEEDAIIFADGVIERTQPTAAVQNLPEIMRTNAYGKLFVQFMSFFTNVHNQITNEVIKLKDHPAQNASEFMRAMTWLWVTPALLSTFLRSLGQADWDEYAKDIALWPLAGVPFVRDLASSYASGYELFRFAPVKGFEEVGQGLKAKRPETKIKHFISAGAFFSGRIPKQWITSGTGAYDYLMDETDDWRRLIWTESALRYRDQKKKSKQNPR